MNPFRKAPVATLVSLMTAVLAGAVTLQGTGLVTGKAGAWLDAAVGMIQLVLGLYARMHATPVANPKDNLGRPLVPVTAPRAN